MEAIMMMSASLGRALKAFGLLGFALAFVWGLALCIAVIAEIAGFAGAVLGLLLAPLSFILVPWYAGLALGDWTPFLLNYCAGSCALALFAGGNAILRSQPVAVVVAEPVTRPLRNE